MVCSRLYTYIWMVPAQGPKTYIILHEERAWFNFNSIILMICFGWAGAMLFSAVGYVIIIYTCWIGRRRCCRCRCIEIGCQHMLILFTCVYLYTYIYLSETRISNKAFIIIYFRRKQRELMAQCWRLTLIWLDMSVCVCVMRVALRMGRSRSPQPDIFCTSVICPSYIWILLMNETQVRMFNCLFASYINIFVFVLYYFIL